MDARTFLNTYGKERCGEVAAKAGTTLGYFLQMAYGYRTPSLKLARRLIKASDDLLDVNGLASPPPVPTKKE